MFRLLGRYRRDRRIAEAVYGAIVAQARNPTFYTAYGVPDTVDGRFEMVVAHMVLALRALGRGDRDSQAAGQAVFDLFCRDMDRALRELGTGDLAVPKRMRRVGEAYYGRAKAYEDAITAADSPALASALSRNVADAAVVATGTLATYMISADRALAAASQEDLRAGILPFPDPAEHVPGRETP